MSRFGVTVIEQVHMAEIKLHRAWNEYRADCSCGHVGSYVATAKAAKADHARHVEATREIRTPGISSGVVPPVEASGPGN